VDDAGIEQELEARSRFHRRGAPGDGHIDHVAALDRAVVHGQVVPLGDSSKSSRPAAGVWKWAASGFCLASSLGRRRVAMSLPSFARVIQFQNLQVAIPDDLPYQGEVMLLNPPMRGIESPGAPSARRGSPRYTAPCHRNTPSGCPARCPLRAWSEHRLAADRGLVQMEASLLARR